MAKTYRGYVRDWFEHDEPGEYWSSLDVSQSAQKINVPALHVSGWYDMYLRGSVAGFLALTSGAATPHARENQYLIAGPWIHIPWGDRIGAADFGADALLDTDAILLRWFNHWLKDSGEFASEPQHSPLRAWRKSAGARRTLGPAAQNTLCICTARAGPIRARATACFSLARLALMQPRDVFVYDPEVPVLAPGGPTAASGQFDQAALELGNNLLVYTTEPLAQPLRIFGTPRVALYCSTSSAHTDFTAKLVRVRPNGAAEFICIGIARSSWLFAESGYAADKVHLWEFGLEPTSCCFAAGECIRLEIASSAFPLYDRNPGTDTPSPRATSWDWRRSTQFVYHDSKHPAALYLPVSETAE